jgi:hypothetical protein
VLSLDARSNGVRRRVAELALRSLARDDAFAVLAEIQLFDPFDTQSLQRTAELYEGAREYDTAVATLARSATSSSSADPGREPGARRGRWPRETVELTTRARASRAPC